MMRRALMMALFVVCVMMTSFISDVTQAAADAGQFRRSVADMKADIRAGRVHTSRDDDDDALVVSVRLEPQVALPGGTVSTHSGGTVPETGGTVPTHSGGTVPKTQSDSVETGQTRRHGHETTHVQHVTPLKVDRFTVTNADFMVFSQAKPRYQTEAEKRGFSWVFSSHVTNMADVYDARMLSHPDGDHWRAVRNASWYQPYGRGSSVADRLNCPVVHVAYRDAFAFCVWANKRLPTEPEWQFIAQTGNQHTEFPREAGATHQRANLWQGSFPLNNTLEDGFHSVSPVDAFPMQTQHGLYDLFGNVWEWTTTVYTAAGELRDRNRPRYTAKGGSFLDTSVSLASRLALYPVYSAENVGFRCVEPAVNHQDTLHTAGGPAADRRTPTRHRFTDTWSYKVKRAFTAIIGGNRPLPLRNEEL